MTDLNLKSECNSTLPKGENPKSDDIMYLYQNLPPLMICGKLIYPEEYLVEDYD